MRNTQRLSTMSNGQSSFPIVAPLAKFQQRGQSGAWVSDLLPYIAGIADDLCFIKTMHTEHVNHDPAAKFLHTGFQLSGRPSIGAWVNYGLGSDNTNLPNFVVMSAGACQGVPLDSNVWASGFLPSHHQGVQFRADADPVLYVRNPDGIEMRDAVHARHARAAGGHSASRVEGPGDSVARQPVRDGLSDADFRARSRRHLGRARIRTGDVRSRREDAGHVRAQLPASRAGWPSAASSS